MISMIGQWRFHSGGRPIPAGRLGRCTRDQWIHILDWPWQVGIVQSRPRAKNNQPAGAGRNFLVGFLIHRGRNWNDVDHTRQMETRPRHISFIIPRYSWHGGGELAKRFTSMEPCIRKCIETHSWDVLSIALSVSYPPSVRCTRCHLSDQ